MTIHKSEYAILKTLLEKYPDVKLYLPEKVKKKDILNYSGEWNIPFNQKIFEIVKRKPEKIEFNKRYTAIVPIKHHNSKKEKVRIDFYPDIIVLYRNKAIVIDVTTSKHMKKESKNLKILKMLIPLLELHFKNFDYYIFNLKTKHIEKLY